MKKLIQLFSLLSLLFVAAAVTANAQADHGSEVEIPFNFIVGDREYQAGKFIIKVNRLNSAAATILIEDVGNERVQTVLARRNADASTEEINLVFEKNGETRFLSRIVTPNGGFAINRSNVRQREVADLNEATRTVFVGSSDLF